MNWLSIDEVYTIHEEIIQKAGSIASVRDFSLLHSAVERPKATYGGVDLYPSIFIKAAALLHSLCMNHPFTDGNKRTSWVSTKRFFKINGCHLRAEKSAAVSFMLSVDNNKLPLNEISLWLKKHCSPLA
ncbi:MAG TPA: type II toxin-antitoxin system death-on-curing family toxin [Patescibacteria group bacterium]|nr:type II toxin-antitoxin system death-on-curing family toxin [Patescibacteria group bacterium]